MIPASALRRVRVLATSGAMSLAFLPPVAANTVYFAENFESRALGALPVIIDDQFLPKTFDFSGSGFNVFAPLENSAIVALEVVESGAGKALRLFDNRDSSLGLNEAYDRAAVEANFVASASEELGLVSFSFRAKRNGLDFDGGSVALVAALGGFLAENPRTTGGDEMTRLNNGTFRPVEVRIYQDQTLGLFDAGQLITGFQVPGIDDGVVITIVANANYSARNYTGPDGLSYELAGNRYSLWLGTSLLLYGAQQSFSFRNATAWSGGFGRFSLYSGSGAGDTGISFTVDDLLVSGVAGVEPPPPPPTFLWTGAGSDASWTTAANWRDGAAPGDGGLVVFYEAGAAQLVTSLGLPITTGKLTFTADASEAVTINADATNRLTIGTGGLEVNVGQHKYIGPNGGSGTGYGWRFGGSTTIAINAGASFEINARVVQSATGQVYQKTGGGTLILSGDNSGSGAWNFTAGSLNIVEGSVRIAASGAAGNTGNKWSVSSGAALELDGQGINLGTSGVITLNGSGINQAGALRSLGGTMSITGSTGTVVLASSASIGVDAGVLTIPRVISGAGNVLTKAGAGILTLSGLNTYTGGTVVANGILRINSDNSAANGPVTVELGGALGGTGTVGGSTTVAGSLAPGVEVGTLTFASNLVLESGSSLAWDLSANDTSVGGAANDLVQVNGSLTLGGTLNVTGIGDFSALSSGSWRLFNSSGAISGQLAIGTMPAVAAGYTWAVDTSTPGQVNVTIVEGSSVTAIEAWRLIYFGSSANAGNAADEADPDGDGIPNLVEFALGGDPTAADEALWSVGSEGGNLVLNYTMSSAARSIVNVDAEWANDLASIGWSSAGVTDDLIAESNGIEQRKAQVEASGERKFLRLKVSLK
jgi:autotransporter-associated beta strand protein